MYNGIDMKWEPEHYCDSEIANALLNCAAELSRIAEAHDGIIYALKYSKTEGMSIAEAIEVGFCGRGGGGEGVADAIRSGLSEIASAIQDHGTKEEVLP